MWCSSWTDSRMLRRIAAIVAAVLLPGGLVAAVLILFAHWRRGRALAPARSALP